MLKKLILIGGLMLSTSLASAHMVCMDANDFYAQYGLHPPVHHYHHYRLFKPHHPHKRHIKVFWPDIVWFPPDNKCGPHIICFDVPDDYGAGSGGYGYGDHYITNPTDLGGYSYGGGEIGRIGNIGYGVPYYSYNSFTTVNNYYNVTTDVIYNNTITVINDNYPTIPTPVPEFPTWFMLIIGLFSLMLFKGIKS